MSSAACVRANAAGSAGGRIAMAGNTIGVAPRAASCAARPAACRAGRVTMMPARSSGPRDGGAGASGWTFNGGAASGPARTPCRSRRDEACGAAREEVVRQFEAELRGSGVVGNLRLRFAAQHVAAVAAREEAAQPQCAFLPLGVAGQRRVAAAAQRARERALRGDGERGRRRRRAAPAPARGRGDRCGTRSRARPGPARAGCRPARAARRCAPRTPGASTRRRRG